MRADPILALTSLGYTEREATFLYLVAVHSGYFVRRQFDYFTDRNKGALVMRLLTKARDAGHLQVLDYKQGWHVYHVSARAIYRLLGDPESQNRRRKGDAQVRAHIIALDYVLENDSDHYFESEAERVNFFTEDRRIAPETFMGIEGRLHSLLGSFPISLADRTRPAQSSVRFAFIDEGHSTIVKFLRFLSVADPLLRAVGNFEVVYVSLSAFNFRLPSTPSGTTSPVLCPRVFGSSMRTSALLLRNIAFDSMRDSRHFFLSTATPRSNEVKPGVLRRVHMRAGSRPHKCFGYIDIGEEATKSWEYMGWEQPHPTGSPRGLTPRWSLPPMYGQRPNQVRRRY